MCDPLTAGIVMGAVQGFSAFKSSSAQKSQLKANAAAERANAAAERKAGADKIAKLNRKRKAAIGSQVARIGASGFDFAGTPLDLVDETSSLAFEDMEASQFNTNSVVARRLRAANNFDAQAGGINPFFDAASAGIQGGISAYGASGGKFSFGKKAVANPHGLPWLSVGA